MEFQFKTYDRTLKVGDWVRLDNYATQKSQFGHELLWNIFVITDIVPRGYTDVWCRRANIPLGSMNTPIIHIKAESPIGPLFDNSEKYLHSAPAEQIQRLDPKNYLEMVDKMKEYILLIESVAKQAV